MKAYHSTILISILVCMQWMVDLRVKSCMKHDQATVEAFVGSLSRKNTSGIAVLEWKVVLPLLKRTVELAVFALPLLDVGQGSNIYWFLQELVNA